MSGRDANQLAADATTARRGIISALIAVKGHLDQPYPDDDRWTPWTRFVEPALQRLDESVKELVGLVGTLRRDAARERDSANRYSDMLDEQIALVGTLQQERDDLQDACRREREARHKMELRRIAESKRAVAAEAALATTRQALELLLEWAEKDRGGGYPEENRSEEWYTHRDFARRALAAAGGDTKEPG